ncbi:hypothetical protein [Couchioplanes caeruleus]|uniref:Uncharacterized protein n=2 Tax=Couchioplanes caeruleus TaxID=56438 RepID=A0A1K0GQM2_9ACTN|nr:hypothetical protein [Couchioplanes caeruleus]OJF14702.1 hypothetical protein BG844_08460 [Couchioplanes caeruleus subsp. caeruleus]
MGLFIIVLLSVATVLLIRNMNKRLRRLPDSFPDERDVARQAEVARLDADLARSEVAPGSASGGAGGSTVDDDVADGEVKRPASGRTSADDLDRGERA